MVIVQGSFLFFKNVIYFIVLILESMRKGETEKEKKTLICCSTYLSLVGALTGDRTHNLGALGPHCNRLSTQPGMVLSISTRRRRQETRAEVPSRSGRMEVKQWAFSTIKDGLEPKAREGGL